MTERVYKVPDVSCEHCVSAITKELSKIDGVASVKVDIGTKLVTVQADAKVTDEQIREGLDEAGYDVAA